MKALRVLLFGITVSALIGPSTVQATSLDLTTSGASGNFGDGALFSQGASLSGTGVFPAFVQLNPQGGAATTESGYNTTANGVNDTQSSDTFNHEITVSQLPIFNTGGTNYYLFLLDINESNNTADQYLSLDQLMLLTSTTANQSGSGQPAGTVRYNMDAGNPNNEILLNYALETGSGRADMVFLVPTANFAGALPTDYVYLYSIFGGKGLDTVTGKNWGVSDGFEEWALGVTNCTTVDGQSTCSGGGPGGELSPVPEPASLVLMGSGLLAAAYRARRKSRKTDA